MTSLKSLETLQKQFLEVGADGFIFTRGYCKKTGRRNLIKIADENGIALEDDKITRYLTWGDSMKLSKTLQDKCPKLLTNASFQEVAEALEFVIKNYKKI